MASRSCNLRNPSSEKPAIRDKKLRVHVQIGKRHYQELKAFFVDMARRVSIEKIGVEFYCLPFEPYAPIRQQLLNILRLVNQARKQAGLETVSPKVLRYQRKIVKPFEGELTSERPKEETSSDVDEEEAEMLSNSIGEGNGRGGGSGTIKIPEPPVGCSLDENFLEWAVRYLDEDEE